jgi:hypothetical protein
MNPRIGIRGKCFVCEPQRNCIIGNEYEDHHVIPEHLGGKAGPLTSLCEKEHGRVHSIAEAIIKKKPPSQESLLGTEGEKSRRAKLAAAIVRANAAVINDPNRNIKFEAIISSQLNTKLAALKKELGVRNNGEFLTRVIEALEKYYLSSKGQPK